MRVRLSRTNASASSGVAAPHREDRANVRAPASGTTGRPDEARMWPRRAGVQPGRRRPSQGHPRQSRSARARCPTALPSVWNPSRLRVNRSRAASSRQRRCSTCPNRSSACTTIVRVAGGVGEHQGAGELGACALQFPLRVPHCRRSEQRSRLGSRRKRRQAQNPLIPPEALGGVAPDHPEPQQPPRDVGRFAGTAALDEPRQRGAIALEILAHAIQPFDLGWSGQPFRGERCFAGRNSAPAPPSASSRSPAAASSRAAYARTVSSIRYSGRVGHGGLGTEQQALVDQRATARERFVAPGRGRLATGEDRRGRVDGKATRHRAEAAERALLVRTKS